MRNRLQLLISAAAEAQREIQKYRDSLVEVHVPMSLRPKTENIPEPEVRADVRRLDALLARLSKALTCESCRAGSGRHYSYCPAATAATTITGTGE